MIQEHDKGGLISILSPIYYYNVGFQKTRKRLLLNGNFYAFQRERMKT